MPYSMKITATFPSQQMITVFVFSLLLVFAGAGHAMAQAPSTSMTDAASAWSELRTAAQQKLSGAENPEAAIREVLSDLERFAAAHAGTLEAAIARFNHGSLALDLGDESAAELSFREAANFAADRRLVAQAEMQLARLAIRPGKTPPDFTAKTLAGKTVSPGDFRGRVVLLDFWATWCGPCIAELPNVQAVYRAHHDAGFDIVSISLDRNKAALAGFLKQREMPWIHVFDPDLPLDARVATTYGVNAIPFMVLIGRDGSVAGVNLRGPALEKAVAEALVKPGDGETKSVKESGSTGSTGPANTGHSG